MSESLGRKRTVWSKKRGPCRLCRSERGRPFLIDPIRSFTENNVVPIGAACQELLRRGNPVAWGALPAALEWSEYRFGEAALIVRSPVLVTRTLETP
jgi:hypothetical protein